LNAYCLRRSLLAFVLFLGSCSLFAGPPLATDDAGVLTKGGWEYTLAYVADKRDAGDSANAPSLEIAYGFSDEFQGSVFIGRVEIEEPGESSRSDFDAIGFEGKWQFYADDSFAVAFVPAYSFPLTDSATDRGIVDDVRVLSLPAVVSWTSGDWTLDGQAVYNLTSTGPNAWFAGVAGGYLATDRIRLLGEVYRAASIGEDDEETNWNVGFEVSVREGLALLASFGGSLDSDFAGADELDNAFYLGFRYDTQHHWRHDF